MKLLKKYIKISLCCLVFIVYRLKFVGCSWEVRGCSSGGWLSNYVSFGKTELRKLLYHNYVFTIYRICQKMHIHFVAKYLNIINSLSWCNFVMLNRGEWGKTVEFVERERVGVVILACNRGKTRSEFVNFIGFKS